MQTVRSCLGLLGTLALAGLALPAGAQPVGWEFQVNTYTPNNQQTGYGGGHLAAADASGNFIVVWLSNTQDGSSYGIFGQRYDSAGSSLGVEFRVNSYTTFGQDVPSVASGASGDFVVVWQGEGQDGSAEGIFGQRYDSGGVAQGGEFRVNSFTTSSQRFPSVAAAADGDFVIVWTSNFQDGSGYGIFGQRYDSGGVAQGNEFRVNSYTTSAQVFPSVASDASGNFVVVWESSGQDGSLGGIFGQRYDSEGVAQGGEFLVNFSTYYSQRSPSVASDTSGNFVVVWRGGYADDYGIFGQRYDSGGVAQGGEFVVDPAGPTTTFPSVAFDASGNFVVVWTSNFQDGSGDGSSGQRYDSEGGAQGGEFQINSYTTGNQRFPSVATTGTNQFVVAWESQGQDGNGYGVFGQRFDFAGGTITVVSPNSEVKWRIGSLQRIKWTHNLGADETFRIELDRNDDGDYEELIAAAAPVDSAAKGSFSWTVTGPPSGTARVRVSWTDDLSVSDSSDVTFQIRPTGAS